MEAEIERAFSVGESYHLYHESANTSLISLECDFRNLRNQDQNSIDARITKKTILVNLENIKRGYYKQLELIIQKYPIKENVDNVEKLGERLDILEKGIKALEI